MHLTFSYHRLFDTCLSLVLSLIWLCSLGIAEIGVWSNGGEPIVVLPSLF